MDVLVHLRSETRAAHERLEEAFGPIGDLGSYVRYLRAMGGFLRPIEPRLSAFPGAAALQVDERRRAHLAAADLAHLARPCGAPCDDLPDVSTWTRALGCLYVLEGSTLGARALARDVERTLGLGPGRGASFLHGHGERTASMWQSFRDAAAAHAERTGEHAQMIEAARDTFAALERFVSRVEP